MTVLRASYGTGLKLLAPVIVAASIVLSATSAFADETAARPGQENGLEEVVVTARRTQESLQSVPISITAITGEELTARGALKASDLMSAVPGLFTAPGSSKGTDTPVFNIRGVENRDPTITTDPNVGVYFAEVPLARPVGTNAAFVDLQSVQVLFGPQGTLFGRNSTAGAILITPNAPTQKLEGYSQLDVGNYGYWKIEGVTNVPVNDKTAFRIVYQKEQRDGYTFNVSNGQKTDDMNDQSFRASLKFDPTDNFSTTVIGTYYDSNTGGPGQRLYGVVPVGTPVNSPNIPLLRNYLAQVNALPSKYDYISGYAAQNAAQLGGFPAGDRTVYTVKSWGVQDAATLNLGESPFLGDLVLKNIASYHRVRSSGVFDTIPVPDPAIANLSYAVSFATQETEELQLQGKRNGLSYIVGGFYFHESGAECGGLFIQTYGCGTIAVNTSYAGFVHTTYDFSQIGVDGLSLDAGVRVTRDERDLTAYTVTQTVPGNAVPNALFNCTLIPALKGVLQNQCGYDFERSFTSPTWNGGLSYKFSPDSMVYLNVGRGYRSGGFNASPQTPLTPSFEPEYVTSYEIGTKNDLHLGSVPVRVNLAGYYDDYANIQRTIAVLLPNSTTINNTINAASARILGGEADITIKPTNSLTAHLAYAYVAPKYKNFSDLYTERNSAYFPPGTPAGVTSVNYPVDISSSRFIQVSKHSVSTSLGYDLPVPQNLGEPTATATYYYRTSFYNQSDISPTSCAVPADPNPAAYYQGCLSVLGKLPGYGLANLRLDWRDFLSSGVDVALFVDNVTNKYYFINEIASYNTRFAGSVQIGPPRMFGASFRIPFGK